MFLTCTRKKTTKVIASETQLSIEKLRPLGYAGQT